MCERTTGHRSLVINDNGPTVILTVGPLSHTAASASGIGSVKDSRRRRPQQAIALRTRRIVDAEMRHAPSAKLLLSVPSAIRPVRMVRGTRLRRDARPPPTEFASAAHKAAGPAVERVRKEVGANAAAAGLPRGALAARPAIAIRRFCSADVSAGSAVEPIRQQVDAGAGGRSRRTRSALSISAVRLGAAAGLAARAAVVGIGVEELAAAVAGYGPRDAGVLAAPVHARADFVLPRLPAGTSTAAAVADRGSPLWRSRTSRLAASNSSMSWAASSKTVPHTRLQRRPSAQGRRLRRHRNSDYPNRHQCTPRCSSRSPPDTGLHFRKRR